MTYISMILILLGGFACGLIIPVLASRFGKILPADPGLVLASLFHKPRFPKPNDPIRRQLLIYKWQKLAVYSVCWAMMMMSLFSLTYAFMGPVYIEWFLLFLFITGLAMAVDQQYFLLPDFLTIPLLFCGFGFAVYTGYITPEDSFLGALFGYVLSTVSVCVMNCFRKAEFGAGDVKMVTALGAWLGYAGLNYTLVISFLLFSLWAYIHKKKTGAFGPALGLAAVIVLFYLYAK